MPLRAEHLVILGRPPSGHGWFETPEVRPAPRTNEKAEDRVSPRDVEMKTSFPGVDIGQYTKKSALVTAYVSWPAKQSPKKFSWFPPKLQQLDSISFLGLSPGRSKAPPLQQVMTGRRAEEARHSARSDGILHIQRWW